MVDPLDAAADNVIVSRLGAVALEVGTQRERVGDSIDRGLILIRRLREEGFALVLLDQLPDYVTVTRPRI